MQAKLHGMVDLEFITNNSDINININININNKQIANAQVTKKCLKGAHSDIIQYRPNSLKKERFSLFS